MTLRRLILPVVGILLVVVATIAVGILSSAGACAAPQPGAHYVPPLKTIVMNLVVAFGPGVATLLLGLYAALGVQRIGRRWAAVTLAVTVALAVQFVALIFAPHSCSGLLGY